MNSSTECMDTSQVDSLLHGNLTPEEHAAAQNHLDHCETCRTRIELTIGPQQWWNDVQSVLSDTRNRSFSQPHAFSTDWEPNESSSNKLLSLLGPTDDPNMLGRIGPYEITGLLGQGGMGAVFKGFDRSLNRFVAIKMLLPHLAASGAARKRFAREGQAVAAVVDDHVMAIHCVDEWQGTPYLVMTYSRGVSLQKRLSDNGPLEVREILRIGMQTARGLAAAHAQGIVHRDIKPANIFLDKTVERVQLMDFGLARAVDDASLTRTGVLAGTPQYMSPEQARAEAVDHRSDLFSLGSVMYAMCTGHAPFRADSSYSVLRLITDKEPRPIREINADVPEWLCSIIEKLMAKQASDRYQSAKELSELLEDCLAHLQQPASLPLPRAVAELAPKNPRRPPMGKLIAAAAFAFALVLAGVFIVLELNKGTLTIQSDADDVRVRITRGDEVIDELKVSKSGQSVRVAAGKYIVEIISESDDLAVENGQITLHRSGTELVRIVHNAHSQRKYEGGGRPKKPASPKQPTISFNSPFQGRLHWGKGIRENAFIKKGHVIAEIVGFDPDYHRQLSSQLSALNQKAEAKLTLVKVSEECLKLCRDNAEALESRLKLVEQDDLSKMEKRQGDLDRNKELLSKTKAETAKVESEVQKAALDLNVTQKEVADLEAKLAEQKSYVFHAPSSGYITDLCLKEQLEKGDAICQFQPESEDAQLIEPLTIGETDKARQGKNSNGNTSPQPSKYFLTLKLYEKREDSVKSLATPTIRVNAGTPFTYSSGGEVNEYFSGVKLNGQIGSLDDRTVQVSLKISSGPDDYEVHSKLKVSETKTVQLDAVTWLDLHIEAERNDSTLKLSANDIEVVSTLVPTVVRGTGSVTITQAAESSQIPMDAVSSVAELPFDSKLVNRNIERLSAITIEKTVDVVVALDATIHSSKLMEANVGHSLLSLLACGTLVRSADGTVSKTNLLYARDCRLQSYKADVSRGRKVWSAVFSVPLAYSEAASEKSDATGPSKQHYEQRVSQEDIDRMLQDGIQFRLDGYLGKPPEPHVQPIVVGESMTSWLEDFGSPSKSVGETVEQVVPAKEEIKHYPVQEAPPEQADLSTPQATLETIDRFSLVHPADVPVACYTDEAILELSGVLLQQLSYQSLLSQLYSHADAQIRRQTNQASDVTASGPLIPGAIPSFHLKVESLFKEHSLDLPPAECKKALESICKWPVLTLDGRQSAVVPDRELYRLAAGVLKSPKEFLGQAGQLSQYFRDSSSELIVRSTVVKSKTQYDIVIKGDEATAIANYEKSQSAIPMKFKLRRVNQRWFVSEAFSDEILTQINLSMPQVSGDTSAIRPAGATQSLEVSAFETELARPSNAGKSPISLDHSKVLSDLPDNWTDFLALLPETGTALVMFSDQPEIREQMSPIAKKVAKGASVQFIEIQRTQPRANDPGAYHQPCTHFLLMKDRQVVDTRYGALAEEKLHELVAKANDWLTPLSTGIEENSLLRIDCYIAPSDGKVGSQSGDPYPITAAIVAVHEDQALLLGPDSVAEYMEKGYACVAIVRDAAGTQKQLPLKVVLNEPVKLLGRDGEPHRFRPSVRITHSDGTSSEVPITSILPDSELIPEPLEKYDVASAIYRIQGVKGLTPVKLAALGETISVGERVLSGSFSQKPIVPVALDISPPVQWQSQTVVEVGGVTGGNSHGPETFSVLCPSLPVPSGYTFNERGRLIGKRLGGNPTHENMRHEVFKIHATHSTLRAALDKIDEAGLKAALARTLE